MVYFKRLSAPQIVVGWLIK